MQSVLNQRLFNAIYARSYEDVLQCLSLGAEATITAAACGKTACGAAAWVGDVEILELLIQSCEDEKLKHFGTSM